MRLELEAQELELGRGQPRLRLRGAPRPLAASAMQDQPLADRQHLDADEQVAEVSADEILARDFPSPGRVAERVPHVPVQRRRREPVEDGQGDGDGEVEGQPRPRFAVEAEGDTEGEQGRGEQGPEVLVGERVGERVPPGDVLAVEVVGVPRGGAEGGKGGPGQERDDPYPAGPDLGRHARHGAHYRAAVTGCCMATGHPAVWSLAKPGWTPRTAVSHTSPVPLRPRWVASVACPIPYSPASRSSC